MAFSGYIIIMGQKPGMDPVGMILRLPESSPQCSSFDVWPPSTSVGRTLSNLCLEFQVQNYGQIWVRNVFTIFHCL